MEINYQIIGITIVLVALLIINFFTRRAIQKFTVLKSFDPNRKKVILNLTYFLTYMLAIILIIGILGVELKQFLIFVSSVLAVLGVGFFAQWSILSNLTSSFILFFYHPIKIGDDIKILDKEFNLTGKVKDIRSFYVLLKTEENKLITIPTNILLQKGIELVDETPAENNENKT